MAGVGRLGGALLMALWQLSPRSDPQWGDRLKPSALSAWLSGFLPLVCGGVVLLSGAPGARGQTLTEHEVKAAFLPKFAAFVDWPRGSFSNDSDPINLCVQGRDPFGPSLDAMVQAQRVNGRPIRVVRMETVGSDSGCHIVFLAGGKQRPAAAIRALAMSPTLTITDSASSNDRGMIDLMIRARKVRFQVDDAAAARSGLVISSKLLALAVRVRPR